MDVNECASNPCENGGICTDSSVDSSVSSDAYRCTCIAGFANGVCEYEFISEYATECSVMESQDSFALGGNCDIDVDECASEPCENGAECTDSVADSQLPWDAYRCSCVPGFANGACSYDFIREFVSECSVMLDGNCDIDVDECASSPCQNGATCTDSTTEAVISVNAYQCTCVAGFANGVCEYDFISEYTAECTVMESDDNSGEELVMSH